VDFTTVSYRVESSMASARINNGYAPLTFVPQLCGMYSNAEKNAMDVNRQILAVPIAKAG
jgi:hypothetical protein